MINLSTSKFQRYLLQALLAGVIILSGKLTYKQPAAISANSPSNIVFIENSWADALKQAKLQNKHIFVDAFTTWCGYCKMLKATTFTDEKAAAFYNSNFINVSIDMEKGQGPQLAAQWRIRAYPTLIIFNANGQPVLENAGFLRAEDLIRFGKQALNQK